MLRGHAIPIDRSRAWVARHGQRVSPESHSTNSMDQRHLALNAEDGTLHFLLSGFLIAGVACLALALVLGPLGGIGPAGPRSTAGWLLLMVALMSMPFGLLLLLLGGAKWLRNAWLSQQDGCASLR